MSKSSFSPAAKFVLKKGDEFWSIQGLKRKPQSISKRDWRATKVVGEAVYQEMAAFLDGARSTMMDTMKDCGFRTPAKGRAKRKVVYDDWEDYQIFKKAGVRFRVYLSAAADFRTFSVIVYFELAAEREMFRNVFEGQTMGPVSGYHDLVDAGWKGTCFAVLPGIDLSKSSPDIVYLKIEESLRKCFGDRRRLRPIFG